MKRKSPHLAIAGAVGLLVILGVFWSEGGSAPEPAQPAAAASSTEMATESATGRPSPAGGERPTSAVAAATPEAPPSLTLAAVGDIMLARSIGQRAVASGAGLVFGDDLAALLRSADITVGNLECAVAETGQPQSKGYTFRAPPSALDALDLAGFDAVSLANNHALDYGPTALLDTASNLARHRIEAVGAGADSAAAMGSRVIVRGGLRIAIVGLVEVAEEGAGFSRRTWEATATRPGVAWADTDTVTASVKAAAASADIVIAMLHFGIEYDANPSARQRQLAHAAIDAGATLVIGSHPHVLQPVEQYGSGLIAYSLGNFVFDGFDGTSNDSAVLRVTLSRTGVDAWELLPVRIVDNGLPRLR